MSDIKLFSIASTGVTELHSSSVAMERSLQVLIEQHLPVFLGVHLLSSEHSTGRSHRGRIDTLGIDENGCPVIIEYKRSTNENVISQGLFYLDWLMDHKAEFKLLVLDQLGRARADEIEWSTPRLLCIAGDFTKYDEHAVQQINRNIELIRYRKFGDSLLLFELVNVSTADPIEVTEPSETRATSRTQPTAGSARSMADYISRADQPLLDLYDAVTTHLSTLGDDVQVKPLKWYVAFKRIKNFACVELHPQQRFIAVYVKVDPSTIKLREGFTRDVRGVGHYGTGDLEIVIESAADLEEAKPLFLASYDNA